MPDFKFSISNLNDPNYGFITEGDSKVHRVANANEFYEALGYTMEVKHAGLLPDEFIWLEYRKDGGMKFEICLQAKIIEYLSRHSALFVEQYADRLSQWIGGCPEYRAREATGCGDCLLHPRDKQ